MSSNIGDAIQRLRQRHGIGQRELAEALGVSAQAVSKWETGKANPDLFLLPGLADYFGVTLDQMVKQDLSKEK